MALALIVASFLGLCGLTASLVYGYMTSSNSQHLNAHFLLSVPATFIVVLSHSMTMFYFIGSGKWLKEQKARFQLDLEVLPAVMSIKHRYFGPSFLTILLTMAATIIGGGAHTGAVPGWLHGALGLVAVAGNVYVFVVGNRCLGINNQLMREIAERIDRLPSVSTGTGG